jgi:dienelactone hydrolase
LRAKVVGTVPHPEFTVERLHFQPMPRLYVAANLYIPKEVSEPLPAILYVCGHARVVEDGVRMGNKTAYQHHGAWFARHGYVCLVVDTIQRGEFEGIHHGTYRYDMWWWNNRGYTPAGVEAWTAIRALDYLQSRDEVDPERLGITGRSGGGAYSWWAAALDDRIAAAVPVAGITSLRNHVVDGCVEGHCDCMYMVNTYRWDFPLVAALVAPRPLLISNSDKDGIFPLDGVIDVHKKVRRIYRLHGAGDKLGLQITEGPHKDTQELRVHAFRWMNRFLKQDDSLIREPAEKFFEPSELKVFEEQPEDERVTTIHESFVPAADPDELPPDRDTFRRKKSQWMAALREKVFGGWPGDEETAAIAVRREATGRLGDRRVTAYSFLSQAPYRLPFYVVEPASGETSGNPTNVVLLKQDGWERIAPALAAAVGESPVGVEPNSRDRDELRAADGTTVYFAPRGVGPTEWSRDERERTHIRRRFMLLGQTADAMRVFDVVRLLDALDGVDRFSGTSRRLRGSGEAAAWALYASLMADGVSKLSLDGLPPRNRDGISLLNVSRFVEMPQLVLMAADQCGEVRLSASAEEASQWAGVASVEFLTASGDGVVIETR